MAPCPTALVMFSACCAATTPRVSMIREAVIVQAMSSRAEQTATRTTFVPATSLVCSSAVYHVPPACSWTLSIALSHCWRR